ncbi:MAG TPA: DNA polymerase III subunit beta [Ktedonobacterales bacterium]
MKFTCSQSDLARGLSTVSHAVSTRSTLPVLANILLTAEGDRLRLSATNLEIAITCWVKASVAQEGTTTIPARLLTEFVGSLPGGDVTLTLQPDSHSLKVQGQRSQATIRGMDPGEFPTIPSAAGEEQSVTLEAKVLREVIREVAFAAATEDARPIFTGVLARVRENDITFAAADSFRLAVRTIAAPGATPLGDVLIPARTLSELARMLPDEGGVRIFVTPNRNQVLFRAEDELEMVSNLIAGQFPNYEAIIPKGSAATRVTVKTEQLRQAAKAATIFARDSSNIVRLKVAPGAITLEANAEEAGDSTTTLDEEVTVDGNGLEIIFNVKYLTDVLGVLGTENIVLELNSAQQPGVVRPDGEEGKGYTYVMMPMHSTR